MKQNDMKQAEINSMQKKEMKLIKQIYEIVWDNELSSEEKINEIKQDLTEEFSEWYRKGYSSFIDWV
ncbi:hypothetical protein [uncultured Treponema sp.]|uniref:hypothetical protein n=1 Tax=uncultured Treponema sp. TaxID=162155 RepID=UPI002592A49A|nr:hypothetical protein [uncultured Treponema sp.]